jgi:outer membrane protein
MIARAAAMAAAVAVALPAAVRAADLPGATEKPAGKNAPLPLWEVGLYSIAGWQPAYPGSDQNLTSSQILPYGVYRGSILRLEGGGVGVRAFRTPRFEWDVSASGSFGSPSNRVHARVGMPDIGTLVQLGPALLVNLGDLGDPDRDPRQTRLEFPVRAVFDAYDNLKYRGWAFEPRFTHNAWQNATTSVGVSASLLFGSRAINDIFYGVAPAYATPQRPAYEARAGLINTVLSGYVLRRISPVLQMTFFANLSTVRGNANAASPLLLQQQNGGVGLALSWAILSSEEKGTE